MEDHISEETLEGYSLDQLAEGRAGQIKQHLRACSRCRVALEGIEPFNSVHYTVDGPVYSRVTRLTTGKVMARHWGVDLWGGKDFTNAAAARRFLSRSFAQMFPEHHGGDRCGPIKERGNARFRLTRRTRPRWR